MPELSILNNRYQIENSLGTGGMALVYRARDLTLERPVAIKILREDFSSDSAFRERFRQEAKAAANLSHPNIVTVHDFGLDSGRLFIVMEFIPGTDLKTILQRRGRFAVEEALQLMIQACAGIGYAHRAGLVHCDVKPQNMLVTPDQRLKVTDFGIARALASIKPEEKTNIVWGSPQYFSPEQAAGGPPSPASDVYSLGVILYEMLTGQLPFIANTASELARLHREAPPTPPRQINPEISPALEQILLKVLSKVPSTRYRTADQLGRVLMTFTNRPHNNDAPLESSNSGSTSPSYKGQKPAPMAAAPVLRPTAGPLPVPARPVARIPNRPPQVKAANSIEENPLDIDWSTWALALLAILAVGGLVPLFVWVYLAYVH